jgi:hypothetical protein
VIRGNSERNVRKCVLFGKVTKVIYGNTRIAKNNSALIYSIIINVSNIVGGCAL